MQSAKTQTKHVTNRQGTYIAATLREKGILRLEVASFLRDDEKIEAFCKILRPVIEDDFLKKLQTSAEKIGARVHMMIIDVDYSKPHNDAALAGGPQTPSNYNVLKVADKYTPSEKGIVKETVILLNYPKGGGNYGKTVQWGLENGLRKTTPHVPFAVGENKPRLNYELGPNPMYVVETTGCTFRGNADACCVWFDGSGRESDLHWQFSFGDGGDWFCFRK
jgi:hypothetical protein